MIYFHCHSCGKISEESKLVKSKEGMYGTGLFALTCTCGREDFYLSYNNDSE